MAELREAQQRMIEDRASLERGDLRVPELDAAGAEGGYYDLSIEGSPPQIVVGLPTMSQEAVGWFRSRYPALPLDFRQGVVAPDVGTAR